MKDPAELIVAITVSVIISGSVTLCSLSAQARRTRNVRLAARCFYAQLALTVCALAVAGWAVWRWMNALALAT